MLFDLLTQAIIISNLSMITDTNTLAYAPWPCMSCLSRLFWWVSCYAFSPFFDLVDLILSLHSFELSLESSYILYVLYLLLLIRCLLLVHAQLNLIVARMSSTFQKMNEKSFEQWSMVSYPSIHNDTCYGYGHTLSMRQEPTLLTHPINTPFQCNLLGYVLSISLVCLCVCY